MLPKGRPPRRHVSPILPACAQIGSGSSVTLVSALPVGVRQLPHAHRLSKRATQRLKWRDYRKTPPVKQTRLHFDIPRSTLNRWVKRYDPHNLATLDDRSSRPRTLRQPGALVYWW